jgi:ribosome-associated protein
MKSAQILSVTSGLKIPLREFSITFSRSSGPGGQNVNKLSTKATLRWPVRFSPSLSAGIRSRFLAKYNRKITGGGDLLITSQRSRDAGRNLDDCLEKLRRMLFSVAKPPKIRRPTKPTRAAVERRLEQKRRRAARKSRRRLPAEE